MTKKEGKTFIKLGFLAKNVAKIRLKSTLYEKRGKIAEAVSSGLTKSEHAFVYHRFQNGGPSDWNFALKNLKILMG